MKQAYVFPGQGSPFYNLQFTSDAEKNERILDLLKHANDIVGIDFSALDIAEDTDSRRRDAHIIQPLLFLSSMVDYFQIPDPRPDMVAGHSLGEFAALVASRAITVQTALELLKVRATAMQKACTRNTDSTMAAVMGLPVQTVQNTCNRINETCGSHVVIANFNSEFQVVISGETHAINAATASLREAGAKSIVGLNVGGAFHSPLMAEARDEFAQAVEVADIQKPVCPIYLNSSATGTQDPIIIRASLRDQLLLPVKWNESVQAMISDGATQFLEFGPGNVLQKLIRKINDTVEVGSAAHTISPFERRAGNNGILPSTEMECRLRDIWSSLFSSINQDHIYVDSSFFHLGGDSLLALRLSQIAREQGLTIRTADVLAFPQLGALAARVSKTQHSESEQVAPFSLLKIDATEEDVRTTASRLCQIEPGFVQDVFPCTPLQEGLLALTSRNRSSYVSRNVLRITQTTDIERLKRSWETVLESMPVLRSRIVDLPGQGLVQVVVKDGFRWSSGHSIEDYVTADEQDPMGLGTPLSRQAMITEDNHVTIVWTVHHAVYDGWTMNMFLKNVRRVYESESAPYSAPFQNLIKHIIANGHDAKDFWLKQLNGVEAPQFPSLPTSSYQPRANDMVVQEIQGLPWEQVNATAATVIRAAWGILTAGYVDSNDVVFGATVNGRQAAITGIESIPGPTIATVPVRITVDPTRKVDEFLQDLQQQSASMIMFEQMGLQNIARLNSDTARACQFQTLLVVQPKSLDQDGSLASGPFQESKVGKDDASRALKSFNNYACMVECVIGGESLEVRINFDDRILQPRQVRRMARQFEHLIRLLSSASTASATLGSLDSISPSDLREMWTWNEIVPSLARATVHQLIMDRAALQPLAPAICAWDGDFTYAELDRISTLLACHLVNEGVSGGSLVPLCFEKSKWTVVSMIAVMKAGGTSIAMDSTQPEERLRSIVRQAQPTVLIASVANTELAARLYEFATIVVVQDKLIAQISELSSSVLPVVNPEDGLYVVFTSGSTGTPKGCMVSHENFSSVIHHQRDAMRYTPTSRVFDFVSYAFDVTWANALQTLTAGGCLCVPSEDERRNDVSGVIQRLHVNAVHVPTSVARLIDPAIATTVKLVCVGGEPMTISDRTRWGSDVEVIQAYGPAECTPPVAVAYVCDAQADVADIGKGFGANLWLVQPQNHTKLVGLGMVGEVLVEGPIVGQGYLHDPKKTKASFIEDPPWLLNGAEGAPGRRGRLYKTGDLARYSSKAEGTMLFIGRKDAQVKIRGQRIELGEVEHYVQDNIHPKSGISVVADKITPSESSNPMLVVFIPVGEDASDPSRRRSAIAKVTAGLQERLSSILPAYMIPSAYLPVAEIPMTGTGKTDRRRLRELGSAFTLEEVLELNATQGSGQGRAPLPGVETDLQQLWAHILGVKSESINAEHSFLRIGGDSIGAMRLVAAAREKGWSLSAADVFDRPVLSDLATVVKPIGEVQGGSIVPFSLLGKSSNLEDVRRDVAHQCGIKEGEVEDVFPCTPLQEGLLSQTVKRPGAYRARKVFQLPAEMDLDKLESAIQQVATMTPILRTRIVDSLGCGLVQAIISRGVLCLRADNLEDYLREDSARRFGLSTLLTNFGLIHDLQTDRKFFVWSIHHALYDGWSRPLMLKQIELAYRGQPLQQLSPLQPFIQHVLQVQKSEPKKFWEDYFEDLEAVAFPELPSSSYRCQAGARSTLSLTDITWPRSGVTASTVVRLAWAMVQSAWTNSSDVVFGVTTTGRQAPVPHIQHIAGPTFATIPTRIVLDRNKLVSEMLHEIQRRSMKALAYEQTGLQYIKRFSSATERACRFQTLLVVQPAQKHDEDALFRLAEEQQQNGLQDFNSYPLMFECQLDQRGLNVEVSFDSAVIDSVHVDRILAQFTAVVRSLCKDDTVALGDIHVASEQDILTAWSWNGKEHASFQTPFQDLFAQNVLEHSDAPAICAWDGELSYGFLDDMSSSLAHRLCTAGIKPGIVAGMYFEKSMWMSVGAVAVFKAGGAIVALDDSQPQERLETILQTAKASVLLTSRQNEDSAILLARKLCIEHVIVVNNSAIGTLLTADTSVPLQRPQPSDPMVIQFTSGSTGQPKGAALSYQNVSSFMHYLKDDLGYTRFKRVYDFASYAFDSAWANLVTTLSEGGCLCVPSRAERDNELAKSFDSYRADMVMLTSSAGRQLLAEGPPASLRWISYGGEKVTRDEVSPLGHVEAVNCYAPCECTCIAVVGPKLTTKAADSELSSLGPGRGTNTWLVDPNNEDRLAPIGAPGELWLEGPLVGLGYIGDKERTATAWMENPAWLLQGSSKQSGRQGRLYRTGDLARYNADGSLTIIGRKDAQVKLRGQRVELEEVEHHVLANINSVHQVSLDAEVFVPKGSKEPLLAVFVAVGTEMYSSPDKSRDYLKTGFDGVDRRISQKIPSYMIPSAYIPIAEMPLTVTFKKNRLKLKEYGSSLTIEQIADMNPWRKQKRLPTTSVEQQLRRLWATILGLEESSIGIDDDFLHIGGDSIASMRLVGAARKQGLHFTVAQVFTNPQLSKLAAVLTAGNDEETAIAPLSLLPRDAERAEVVRRAAVLCKIPEKLVEDIYPCTPLQEGMLALTAKDADSKAYVAQIAYEFIPGTNMSRFGSAIERLYALTPILRTRIVDLGKAGLAQVVLREVAPWIDHESNKNRSSENLGLGQSLSRCELVGEGANTRFEWLLHHALYDGWMLGLLHERLYKLYHDEQLSPSPPLQPFICHVSRTGEGDAVDFWTRQLEGSAAPAFPTLPSPGYQPTPKHGLSKLMEHLEWPSNTGITQTTYIQAAWAVLSACYTNTDESIFGVTVSGRNTPVQGIEEMLIPAIATLPFRVILNRDDTVGTLLNRVQSQSVAAIPFAQTGLNRIRRISPEIEDASQFQTLLLVNMASTSTDEASPRTLFKQVLSNESLPSDGRDMSAFSTYALTVQCDVTSEGINIYMDFDANVIAPEQVDRIGLQFQHILRQMCLPPSEIDSISLNAINIVCETDLTDMWTWNKSVPPPVDACVHELFGECVQKHPLAPAICAWDGELTYKKLDSLSTRLAYYLIHKGLAGPGQIVPLAFDKSLWAVVAIFGVMKAGGASVLVDASQPQQRLRSIFDRVKAVSVLCSPVYEATMHEITDCTVQAICENRFQLFSAPEDTPLPKVRSSDTLYVSFTSGSTGQPKGVVVQHTHFSSAIRYQHLSLGYEPCSSRVYDFASYSFDISWSNMLQALGSGACLCIPSEEDRKNDIAASFNALRANMVDLTPSISRTLSPESMPGLKTLISGGEAVRKEDVERWTADGRRLILAYGPAETTPTSTVAEFNLNTGLHNIGYGVGCCSWVVDPVTENLVPVGGVGELWTEGPIVCSGYLEEPVKTAAAFVEDPPWLLRGEGAGRPGRRGRLYKTGDLVRFNLDGSLDFISRKDDQIKIRGQRIELAEIEQTIERCLPKDSTAGQVLVEKILPKNSHNPMLAAFFPLGSAAGNGPTDNAVKAMQAVAEGLEERLAELLPGYMLPGAYIPVHHIPVTVSGKKDRKKLREIGGKLSLEQLSRMHIARQAGRKPSTEAEKQFQQLFAQVLGIEAEAVTADDSFFSIGGDSIVAMRLAVAARELDYDLSVADVLRNPQLGRLAELAERSKVHTSNGLPARTMVSNGISNGTLNGTTGTTGTSNGISNGIPNGTSDSISIGPLKGILNGTTNGNTNGTSDGTSLLGSEFPSQDFKTPTHSSSPLPVTDFQRLCIKGAMRQPPEWWNAFYMELPSVFDRNKIIEACRELWRRYDVIRFMFTQAKGVYQQHVPEDSEPDITILSTSGDLGAFSYAIRTESLRQPVLLGSSFAKFILTYDHEGNGQLTLQLSHAVYDGISLGHLMEAFASLLQDQPLPPSPSFANFIRLVSNNGNQGLDYWRSLLQNSTMTRIPPDNVSKNEIISLRKRFPLIRTLESVTAATVFTAACAQALSNVTKQTDVIFGRLVSGRSSHLAAASGVVGACINFVPVRVCFNDALSFSDAIQSVNNQFLDSMPYENIGLRGIAASCTDGQGNATFASGVDEDLGFGFTVQYETHDEDPNVTVLGQKLTLKWHTKPAESLYVGCVAVSARQDEEGLSVSVSGSESRIDAMRGVLDALEVILGSF